MADAEPAREGAAVPESHAAAYAGAILAERPGFLPALVELERLQVCARCCLRFAGVRNDTYSHAAPPVALLRQTLEGAAGRGAAAGSPAAGQPPPDAAGPRPDEVGRDYGDAAPSSQAAQAPADGHAPAEPVCRACLGVLQSLDGPLHMLPPYALAKLPETDGAGARWLPLAAGDPASIAAHVREQRYESRAFALEISVPGSAQLRQLALWRHLQAEPACAGLFPGDALRDDVVDLKESLRLLGMLAEQLQPRLGQPLDAAGGDLRVTANYVHPASAPETDFLFSRPFGGRAQKRKRRRTDTLEVGRSSSETIAAAAARFPPDRLRAECLVPPGPVTERVSLMLACRRTPTYVGGCYRKLQRDVSQSPWVIDGTRKGRTSVQEEIERVLLPALRCDGAKFITAGREDIDVRMLGEGRPFVLEVQNQRAAMPPPERFAAMERQLAESGVGVEVRKLQPVTKELLQAIKDGEQRKQKSYRALCELPCEATPEVLARLNACGEVELAQETPARVAHRRALLVRRRTVHTLAASLADAPEGAPAGGGEGEAAGRRVVLHLRTQAGTYVKEFVHGDEGRTTPSLGSLAGCEAPARILELDVLGVHMDFL